MPRTSRGRSTTSWASSCATGTIASASTPAATRSSPPSTTGCSGSPRSGSTRRRSSPTARTPSAVLKARGIPRSEWAWIKGLRGHNIHNAAAGVVDYRTGDVLAYAGSASYTREEDEEAPAAVRRPRRRLAPARVSHQAPGLPHRDRRQDDDGRHDVHGRRDELRGQVPAHAGRPSRAGPGAPAERAPVLAQHPGHQGGLHQRPGAPVQADEGLRPALSEDRAARRVAEHRHARDPPDRPDRRLRGDRERRRAHAQAHDPARARRQRGPGLAAGGREAEGHARGRAGRRLHHHRHPGRQHPEEREPVLGPVADHQRGHERQGPPGRLQDGDDERQPRRPRLRLPRATLRQEAPRPRRRGLDGQLRQLAQRWPALARHVGSAVERDPVGGLQGHADRGVRPRPAQGAGHGEGRRVHRHASGAIHDEGGQRAVPGGHAAEEGGAASGARSTSTTPAACCGARAASGPW